MKGAYDAEALHKLAVIKEAKRWQAHHLIEQDQLETIRNEYTTKLYHPNWMIRILLFAASLLGLSGVSGLAATFVAEVQMGENAIAVACMFYGIISFLILEKGFIGNQHYKSGVTEALLYHACGFTIGGLGIWVDFNPHDMLMVCLLLFAFTSMRYLDLLSTLTAILSFAGILFFESYSGGTAVRQLIPFLFMIVFAFVYWYSRKLKKERSLWLWQNNFLVVESVSLLFIYLGGNYLVVRELSTGLMDLSLEEGQDIPYAFIFYFLTVLIPIVFLYGGIKFRDIVLLRVSLFVLAFSVFTFRYYFSLGHPEVALTISGVILLAVSIALIHYLKINRRGFTRENILSSKWANVNAEAFLVSQTLGGNQGSADSAWKGEGGSFGGGGSSGSF